MSRTLRIYISVCASDRAYCRDLLARAADADLDVWYDRNGSDDDDASFSLVRRQEIFNRPACLVLLSPATFASLHMRREHEYIATMVERQPERILLPLAISAFDPALLQDWPLRFTKQQFEKGGYVASDSKAASELLQNLLHPSDAAPDHQPIPLDDTLTQARALLARGNLPAAQKRVEACVAQDPERLFPRYCLGMTQNMVGSHKAAANNFALILKSDPQSVAAWVMKAEALYQYGKVGEAFEALDKVVELDPANSLQWQIRGRAWGRAGEWQNALAAFEQSLSLEPVSAACWYDKGKALHYLRGYEEALVALDRSLQLYQTPAGWESRAQALIQLQRNDEAMSAYDRCLALLHPSESRIVEQKGLLLTVMGQPEAAIAAFDDVLGGGSDAKQADRPDIWFYRGLQLQLLRRYGEALASFNSALGMYPSRDDEEQEDNENDPHSRLRDTQTIVAKGDREILRYKALTLVTMGRYPEALPIYAGLIRRMPIDADLWNRIGLTVFMTGDTDEAIQALRHAQILVPEDAGISRTLDRMQQVHPANEGTAALRDDVIATLTAPYDHSRRLQRRIEQTLHIPYWVDHRRTLADQAMEDVEDRRYGFAYLEIDKIVTFDDIPGFLTLARRLSTVPGVELDEDQRTPYSIANNPVSLALFIYYKLLARTEDTRAREPLEILCRRFGIDITTYLPKRYKEGGSGASDEKRTETVSGDNEEERIDLMIKQGLALHDQKEYAAAATILEKVAQIDPERGVILMELADIYQALGRDDDALVIYDRMVKAGKGYSGIYYRQARTYIRLKRLKDALVAIDAACARAENEGSYGNPRIRCGILRGQILLELNRAPEALETLNQLIAWDPQPVALWLERGRIHTQMGNWASAVVDFEQATRLQDGDAYALHNLAYALNRCDRFSEALAAIDRALLQSTDAAILGTKGEIYLRMGDYTRGLAWIDQALAKDPSNGEHWYDRASALRGLGRLDEAEAAEARTRALPDLRPDGRKAASSGI
jgi:tetratricopeptide (TPR) repeat protein